MRKHAFSMELRIARDRAHRQRETIMGVSWETKGLCVRLPGVIDITSTALV